MASAHLLPSLLRHLPRPADHFAAGNPTVSHRAEPRARSDLRACTAHGPGHARRRRGSRIPAAADRIIPGNRVRGGTLPLRGTARGRKDPELPPFVSLLPGERYAAVHGRKYDQLLRPRGVR